MQRHAKARYQEAQGIRGLRKLKNKVLGIAARFMLVPSLRLTLYRWMGVKIGKGVFVGMDSHLDDEVPGLITIEDGVTVAFRVTLVAHDDATATVAPVLLERDAYVGTGAIVLMGVTIGEGAVVGAGAVVTDSVAAGETVAGVPARPVRAVDG